MSLRCRKSCAGTGNIVWTKTVKYSVLFICNRGITWKSYRDSWGVMSYWCDSVRQMHTRSTTSHTVGWEIQHEVCTKYIKSILKFTDAFKQKFFCIKSHVLPSDVKSWVRILIICELILKCHVIPTKHTKLTIKLLGEKRVMKRHRSYQMLKHSIISVLITRC